MQEKFIHILTISYCIIESNMYAKKLKIASIIVTYNRVEEAKAQMDIIRELWQPMFESVDIYHEFNGEKLCHPQKYKEDFLHRHKPMPHFVGANHMLNQGIKHVLESGNKYDYIIASSADVWFYDPKKIKEVIKKEKKAKVETRPKKKSLQKEKKIQTKKPKEDVFIKLGEIAKEGKKRKQSKHKNAAK